MQTFQDLKTAAKIIGLVVVMAVFLIAVGSAGGYSSNNLASTMDDMYKNRLLPIKWLNAARAQSRAVEGATFELFLTQDKGRQQQLLQEVQGRVTEVDRLLGDYSKTQLDQYEQEQLPVLLAELQQYRVERNHAVELMLAGKQQEAYVYFANHAADNLDNVNDLLKALADHNAAASEEDKVKSEALVAFINKLMIGITLTAIVLAVGIGWIIAKMIANPLAELVERVRAVAQGNLAVEKLEITANDEIGQLAAEFNIMTETLRGLVQNVSQTAEQVAASAEELTAGAEQSAQVIIQVAATIGEIAQGAVQQVHTVDETVAVVAGMSAGIEQIAVSADAMSEAAAKTSSAANNGDGAVAAAMQQMEYIESAVASSAEVVAKLGERSQEIGQIVDTISGIAGQTNLLALNAAIEAARAGEQGRGFSVVAEEVRKLAEQSHASAEQIALLISEIQTDTERAVQVMQEGEHEVKTGAAVVNHAGAAFKEIAQLIDEVSSQVQSTAAAIQEMAASSRQIVIAVQDIDQISKESAGQTQSVSAATEEQSASMEEIAASSHALAKMAEKLQQAVRKFQV